MALQWSEDLGLNYTQSGFNVRSAYKKGLCIPIDFNKFDHDVAQTDKIKFHIPLRSFSKILIESINKRVDYITNLLLIYLYTLFYAVLFSLKYLAH